MLSLYFHVPFCEKKCNYCNFYIIPKTGLQNSALQVMASKGIVNSEKGIVENRVYEIMKERYMDSLLSEISFQKKKFGVGKEEIYTIYFGGGTPSEFETGKIKEILLKLNDEFDLSNLKEFSFELNPYLSYGDIVAYIRSLYEIVYVINKNTKVRFSIGIQSIDDEILKLANREYGFMQIVTLLRKLQSLKKVYQNLSFNLDLISFGLEKKDYFEKFNNFVETYFDVIDSYSIYTLELYPGSIWYEKFNVSEDEILNNFKMYINILKKSQYLRYEISNFSKKGKESLHNQVYWTGGEYLGFGTSASGFVGLRSEEGVGGRKRVGRGQKRWFEVGRDSEKVRIETEIDKNKLILENGMVRYTNSFSFVDYINKKFSFKEYKILSKKEFLEEKVFLGLRTISGIKLSDEIKQVLDLNKLNELINEGFFVLKDSNLRLTEKGFDVYNYVLTEIIDF